MNHEFNKIHIKLKTMIIFAKKVYTANICKIDINPNQNYVSK